MVFHLSHDYILGGVGRSKALCFHHPNLFLLFFETTAVFSTKLAKGESSEDLNQRRKAEPEILCLLLGQGKICLQMINFVEVSSSKKVSFPVFSFGKKHV